MKQRSSNIELLRIVSMYLIVLSHYVYFAVLHMGQDNAFETWREGSTILKFFTSSCILGQIGVGIFFSITGYFSIDRKEPPKPNKITSTVLFYALFSALIIVVGTLTGAYVYESRSDLILLFLRTITVPLTGSLWWFVTAYVALILFSKTINSFMTSLNKKGYIFILLLIGIFGLILGELGSTLHDLEKAIFYYLLGGYFKLYSTPLKKKNVFSSIAIITLLLLNGVLYYNVYIFFDIVILRKLFSMMCILVEPILVAMIFYLFVNLKIGTNAFINKIASFTFGIYLFHEAPYTRELIWNQLVRADKYCGGGVQFLTYSIAVVSVVFTVGMIIDFLRQKLVDKHFLYIIDSIDKKITQLFVMKNSSKTE
nr:acyltransferase [uncultured Flavobacterium sp.]